MGRLTELASGVDALYLSGQASPPASLFEQLEGLRVPALVRRSGGREGPGLRTYMSGTPNFDRVAAVLLRVALRLVGKDDEPKGGGLGADYGVLPSVDRAQHLAVPCVPLVMESGWSELGRAARPTRSPRRGT